MVRWHHQLNGYEFEQAPGDGEGQGSLACCSSKGRRELNMTEQLNNKKEGNRKNLTFYFTPFLTLSFVYFNDQVVFSCLKNN